MKQRNPRQANRNQKALCHREVNVTYKALKENLKHVDTWKVLKTNERLPAICEKRWQRAQDY